MANTNPVMYMYNKGVWLTDPLPTQYSNVQQGSMANRPITNPVMYNNRTITHSRAITVPMDQSPCRPHQDTGDLLGTHGP